MIAQEEQPTLQTILNILGNDIAHELRTPLAAIRTGVSGVKDYVPDLISVYEDAVKNGLAKSTILQRDLELLKKALDIIESAGNRASSYVSQLVTNLTFHSNYNRLDRQLCSILDLLKQVLESYSFKRMEDKSFIQIHPTFADFSFTGSPLLLKNIFMNLIDYLINKTGNHKNSHIVIFSEISSCEYSVCFREMDHGNIGALLFGEGAEKNLGLFFCENLLKLINGKLIYQFYKNQHREIVIAFSLEK